MSVIHTATYRHTFEEKIRRDAATSLNYIQVVRGSNLGQTTGSLWFSVLNHMQISI